MRYGSACKHMCYLVKQYTMLVVEDATWLVKRPPLQAQLDINLDNWVLDTSFWREILPVALVGTELPDEGDVRQSKRLRVKKPHSQCHGPDLAKAALDANELLMTDAEFTQFLLLLPKRTTCLPIPTPIPSTGPLLNQDELVRHLLNMSSSLLDALQQAIDLLKFSKNRRIVAKKKSPEWMWTFKKSADEIC